MNAQGLAVLGYRVMETVGRDITDINFSRGFAIELGSTLSVVLASVVGEPPLRDASDQSFPVCDDAVQDHRTRTLFCFICGLRYQALPSEECISCQEIRLKAVS